MIFFFKGIFDSDFKIEFMFDIVCFKNNDI